MVMVLRDFGFHVGSLAVLEMGRYKIQELLFVNEFHTGTYQYIL
jgi:hypothetical protein